MLFCHLVPSPSSRELVGQLGGSELMASSVSLPVLAANSSLWPPSPHPWALLGAVWASLKQPGHAQHQLNDPPCSPWQWGNSCAMLQASRQSLEMELVLSSRFQNPARFFLECWSLAGGVSPGLQCSCTHSWACSLGTFPALPLCPEVPSSMKNAETSPGINTDFCSPSFIVPLCFRIILLEQKFLKYNVFFHEKLLSRDMGSEVSAAAQTKACGCSISLCNPCMGPVSLPDLFSSTCWTHLWLLIELINWWLLSCSFSLSLAASWVPPCIRLLLLSLCASLQP